MLKKEVGKNCGFEYFDVISLFFDIYEQTFRYHMMFFPTKNDKYLNPGRISVFKIIINNSLYIFFGISNEHLCNKYIFIHFI